MKMNEHLESVEKVLEQTQNRYLDNNQASEFLRKHNGFIPILVQPKGGGKLVWLDVNNYQFTEAKFIDSLKNLASAKNSIQVLITDLDLLESDIFSSDVLYPTGFIFFAHRCGSTLLAKSLARSSRNIVISEATALYEGLWFYLSQGWKCSIPPTARNFKIVKNLVLALGRQRRVEQKTYFIKFHPWQSVFIELITATFPNVPCLFLYRDVAEILVSALRTSSPTLSNIRGTRFAAFLTGLSIDETGGISRTEYFARLYREFMLAVLNSSTKKLAYLNYNQLTASNLSHILNECFNYRVPVAELETMQNQFSYYSKDNNNTTLFLSDKAEKQKAVTSEIRNAIKRNNLTRLYERLEQSERNLFRVTGDAPLPSPLT